MCREDMAHLLALRQRFAAHDFQLTFIVKDDYASETAAEGVDGERVFVDPELGFYHALGFHKSSLLGLLRPTTMYHVFRTWRNGFAFDHDGSQTDGLVHGGVLAVAAPGATASGRAELLFEKAEEELGDTLVHSPAEEARLFEALEAFSAARADRRSGGGSGSSSSATTAATSPADPASATGGGTEL